MTGGRGLISGSPKNDISSKLNMNFHFQKQRKKHIDNKFHFTNLATHHCQYLFSYDKLNYARMIPVYQAEMTSL